MVTVNSISATPRGSMGRGLSSLEPGERRAQRSASTLSPDYLALDRSRFASRFLSFYPRFYFPLSFIFSSILSYCFRHSLYYSSLFPHKTPSLFSLYHSPHYIFPFSIFYIFPSFPSLLPLLFHNPFIILFLFVIPKTLLLLSPLYS